MDGNLCGAALILCFAGGWDVSKTLSLLPSLPAAAVPHAWGEGGVQLCGKLSGQGLGCLMMAGWLSLSPCRNTVVLTKGTGHDISMPVGSLACLPAVVGGGVS